MAKRTLLSQHAYRPSLKNPLECIMCGRRPGVHVSAGNTPTAVSYQDAESAALRALQDNDSEGGFSRTPSHKGGRPKLTPAQRKESARRRRDQDRERKRVARSKTSSSATSRSDGAETA